MKSLSIFLLLGMLSMSWGQSPVRCIGHECDGCIDYRLVPTFKKKPSSDAKEETPNVTTKPPIVSIKDAGTNTFKFVNPEDVKAPRIPIVTEAVQIERKIDPAPEWCGIQKDGTCKKHELVTVKGNWTCSDPKSVLMESVDHSVHVCVRF